MRAMTKLLEKALEQVAKLPEAEQDFIAQLILDELADEALWAKRFAESKDVLRALVEEADEDIDAGRVYPLEFPRRK